MNKFLKTDLNSKNILSSINFINSSDFVFSATVNLEDFQNLDIKNFYKLKEDNGLFTFINLEIVIKENSIIYCHADYVELLFKFLQNCNFRNLILLSSQSDRQINKKLFKIKPACIKVWFATNVTYQHRYLIPIPLGVSPYRNSKSVIIDDILEFKDIKIKENLLYSNFNINTNYFHRKKAIYFINKYNFSGISQAKSYKEYLIEIAKSEFAFAPWGNGIDTHRFWEALYLGTIPVTKKHKLYESFDDIPMVLVKSYKYLNKLNKIIPQNHLSSKLNFGWWFSLILSFKNNNNKNFSKYLYTIQEVDYIKKYEFNLNSKKFRNKKLKTLLRKLDQKINIFHKI